MPLAPEAAGDVLTLEVGGALVGVPAAAVAEVVRPGAWTRVPHGPASLLGVVNLRGAVLPVVSLAALLGRAAAPAAHSARVVVLAGAAPVGLLVDAVSALGRAWEGQLLDPASLLARDFGTMLRRAALAGPVRADGRAGAERGAARDMLGLIGMRLGEQEYALPLDHVAEVLRVPPEIVELPRTDGAMLGVMAFRGGLLPLVSLRALLGMPMQPARRSARVVVTVVGGALAGLVVDAVTATLAVPADAIDPVPPVLTRGAGEAQIEGICRLAGGRRLVCVLSPARLFDAETAVRIRGHGNQEGSAMAGQEADGAVEQFVVFWLGDEQYGLPIGAVDEVVRRPEALTRLPHAPEFVAGVINLRGRVVPLIDAGRRFGTAGSAEGGRRVIIVRMEGSQPEEGLQAGFVVDGVSEVLAVPRAELRPAPEFEAGEAPLFDRVAVGRDGRMILLISPRGLLLQAERDLLAALAEAPGAGRAGA